jgi:hypothetical protein
MNTLQMLRSEQCITNAACREALAWGSVSRSVEIRLVSAGRAELLKIDGLSL